MSDSRADMDFGRFSRDDGSIHEPGVPSNRQRNQSPTMFASNSSSGAMRPMDPPSPHKNLLQGILRPTPDFSRMFDSYIAPPTEREATDEADNPQRIVFSDYVEPLQSRSTVPQEYIEDKRHKQNAENHARPQYSTDFKLIGVESSPVHPEILKVLNWQNEQLKLLQEQVQVLLQSSPQTKHVDKDGCNAEALTPTTTQPIQENPLPNVRSVSSVSTNTSSLWPEIQEGLNKLHDAVQKEQEDLDDGVTLADMRNSEIKVNSSDGGSLRSPQPTLNIDLPDYPGSECSPDLRKQGDKVSWESPVLGESVSMYEEQKNAEVYNDILSQVNRLLGQPPPHQVLGQPPPQQVLGQPPPQQAHGYAPPQQPLGHPPPPQSLGQPPPQQPELSTRIESEETYHSEEDPARATFNRLRELGISFISPEDLSQPRSQENCNPQDYSNLFLPRASCPSQSIWRDSPDTSLEISSLALKYLDETQLSSLADKHRTRGQATVRSNSRAENNMSMATQQFLNRHGLDSRENRNPLRSLDNSGRTTLQETNQAEMRKNVVPFNKEYGDTLQTLQQAQFTQKTGPNPQQAGQYIQQTVQYTQQARQYVQQPEHNTHGARQFAQEGRQYKKHGQYNQVAGHYGQVAEQYNQQPGQYNQQPGQNNQQPGQYNQQPGQYTQAGHRPQEFGQHFQEDRHYKEAGQYNQDGGHHTQGAGQYKHPIADQQVRNVRIQEPANGLNCTPTGRTNKDIPNRVLDIEAIKRQPKLM